MDTKQQSNNVARFWELDALRGVAIFLMVSFHFVFDLQYYYGRAIETESGFWYVVGKSAAILFIWLAGISSTLSGRACRHGVRLLLWGMLITGVTYWYEPATYVRFGVLHLLGVSLLTTMYVRHWTPGLLILAGLICLAGGLMVQSWRGNAFLLPLGIMPHGFMSLDYYPIFPWYGVFLGGVAAGKLLYRVRQPLLGQFSGNDPLSWLGRHSLWIYLLHQPLLLLVLAVIC